MPISHKMNCSRNLPFLKKNLKWIVLSGLIGFYSFPLMAQNELDLTGKSSNQNGFSIYSSETHEMVQIDDLGEWEQYRSKLKRNMEAVMGVLPDREKLPELDIRIKDSLQTERYLRLNIDFLAVEGERVPAYMYIPHRSSVTGKLPAILALHPTATGGKKTVDGEGSPNWPYARELAERGYIVIAPDYPSLGELSDYDFNNDRYQSGTMAGIFYHMRCVDLLLERDDVDPDRIGAIGHSLGGHNAMFVAAFDERVEVVVSSGGWNQLAYYDIGPRGVTEFGGRLGAYAQDRYMPLFRDKYNLDGDLIPIDYHEIIALLAPRGLFSNAPLKDQYFDPRGVIKGLEMVKGAYQFFNVEDKLQVRYPEGKHDFLKQTRKEAYEFIDQELHHIPSKHQIE